MQKIQFKETPVDKNQKIKKTLICSKPKEGTAESSGATRFSNTFVDVY